MSGYNPLSSTPIAILIGSLVISTALLVQGGILQFSKSPTGQMKVSFGQPKTGTPSVVGAGQVAGAPVAPTVPEKVEVDPITDSDHIRGDKDARIVLFEYSDLECPFCKRFHTTAKQAVEDYQGQVVWVYRHFPLDQLHSKARKEAEAVECAQQLGGAESFWALTDKIYEVTPANNGLDLETLPSLASGVGLDQGAFKTCLDSGKYKELVESHYQSGVKAGVNGTPGNILMDTKTGKTVVIPGAVPIESLKSSIDELLKG